MGTRLLVLSALCVTALQAQSISVVTPGAGATWTGWTGQRFTVSLTGAPSVVQVCYTVDAYPATNPGADPLAISGSAGALYYSGCANSVPYSFPVNTFWWADGTQHQVVATAYDGTGAVIATSPAVTFNIANTWPIACSDGSVPQSSVSAGTPFSSNWSGLVPVTVTVTGACASDNITATWFLDGGQIVAVAFSSGSKTVNIDTTQVQNGPHVIAVTIYDTTRQLTFVGAQTWNVGAAGEFSQTVTIANSAVASSVRNTSNGTGGGGRTLYLTPASTYTLTPTLINTDGTTASGTIFDYVSTNTNIATVSYTLGAGQNSTTVTGVAQGAAQVITMAETTSASDAGHSNTTLSFLTSTTLGNNPSLAGNLVRIISGTGCIPGIYYIGSENPNTGQYALQWPMGTAANFVTSSAAGSCSFTTGQTRVSWAQVSATAVTHLAHFSNDGAILTSYIPGRSAPLNESFNSTQESTSQVYPVPYMQSVCASGYNALEMEGVPADASSWSYASPTAMATAISSSLTGSSPGIGSAGQAISQVPGCASHMGVWLTGDNFWRTGPDLYALTQGYTSARNGSTWSTSGIATAWGAYSAFNASGPPYVRGMTMVDEFAFGGTPWQGPTTLGGATNIQNWLGTSSSIMTAGTPTVCTINGNGTFPATTAAGYQMKTGFIITGSTTSGMNSVVGGTLYAILSGATPTTAQFNCPSVVAGLTLNSINDPNLRINTMSAAGWFTPPGGSSATDFTPDDAIAYFESQILSVPNAVPSAPSIAGDAGAPETACVNGGQAACGQSLTVGGKTIYGFPFDDQYSTHSAPCEQYLAGHFQLNGYISDNPSCTVETLPHLRAFYGSYNPQAPMISIGQVTSANFGYASAQDPVVTSCIGNTITFSGPHKITNILPGYTRLWITGSTDPNCNTNLVVLSAPTPTTATVAYAATQTTCTGACSTGNGGTITFQNGDTLTLSSIEADGLANSMGNGNTMFTYSNSAGGGGCALNAPCSWVNRHRGQTFTLSGVTGTAAAYFNSTTFIYDIENLVVPTDGNGSLTNARNFYREIPNFSGTGGTANIVYDGSFVVGRNPSNYLNTNTSPTMTGLSIGAAMLAPAVGHRDYQTQSSASAYNPQVSGVSKAGWVAAATSLASLYGQTSADNQLYSHPNVESGMAVPSWHIASLYSMMWTRLGKFMLGATPLNATDYDQLLESATFQSSYGYLHMVGNFSNAQQTRTVTLTPYETSGQNVILWVLDPRKGILPITIINAGTATYSLTLLEGQMAFFAFPVTFAGELNQPTVEFSLADGGPNAASIAANCGYDQYLLPNAIPMNLGGGTGGIVTAQLMMDDNVGPVYCTLSYLGSSSQLLAGGSKSAVLTF